MNHLGRLYIISAPSGAGKTSLVKQLLNQVELLTVSISHTTRAMRQGEIEGEDYFFVSTQTFADMIENRAFLEYAQVFDNFYGTSREAVVDHLRQGFDVILEIDWQGAQQVKTTLPEAQSIFILPPSIAVLQQRLRSRGQDDEATIARRVAEAVTEISHHGEFDYLVVNDDFNQALAQLKSIIIAQRLQKSRQLIIQQNLLHSLLKPVRF